MLEGVAYAKLKGVVVLFEPLGRRVPGLFDRIPYNHSQIQSQDNKIQVEPDACTYVHGNALIKGVEAEDSGFNGLRLW